LIAKFKKENALLETRERSKEEEAKKS